MGRFVDRRVVVTGGASGIGLETSRRFAAEGGHVHIVDRDGPAARAAIATLAGTGHGATEQDVADEHGWSTLAAALESGWGSLDVLVNNAGSTPVCAIETMTLAAWRTTLAVNLDSAFLGTRALLPLLSRSGRGAIVNVSSIRGIIGGINVSAYCAAKGALRLFTKATALECAALGNGVRANSIHPGYVETPLASSVYADRELLAKRLAAIPLGRAGEPQDVAAAILYVASDEAGYMTGSEIVIDGGTLAQ